MAQIIIKYKLKAGVTREQYENWTRTTDYPSMRSLQRVSRFTNYRVERPLMGDAAPSVDYVEFFDVLDIAGFIGEDMGSEVVQKVMGEFMQFVDSPEFLIAEEVV
ncbi:MAG: hypothetical protein PHE17_12270 [Thiothrix sp.]|uniref:hypothetical protein n=1 Tax=Thiothrix sp. TaxID=1032 RepID=UPI00260B1C31|nr:hypothetical protein [Thiothrix sp.]MDD5393785.1 hypothetical protein [Thiothrix sp.]